MTDFSRITDMNDLHLAVAHARDTLPLVPPVKISARNLNFWYDKFLAVKDIRLDVPEKRVTALYETEPARRKRREDPRPTNCRSLCRPCPC